MNTTRISQKALIFNPEGKILVVFRTETAPTRPNEWDIPGGELEFGEDATQGMEREILEEAGLKVTHLQPFHIETVVTDQAEYWVLITYAAQTTESNVTLSYEHNDFRWVTTQEFRQLSTSPRQKRALAHLKDEFLDNVSKPVLRD